MSHSRLVSACITMFVGLASCSEPPQRSVDSAPARRLSLDPGATFVLASRLYADPASPPIEDSLIIIKEGKIASVHPAREVTIPASLAKSPCAGGVVTAGFHNNHVHFTEMKFEGAAAQPAGDLARHLDEMLARYGFTTVTDAGSDIGNTAALRKRIESGEIPGPRILSAGIPQYPRNGIPFYLEDLPEEILIQLRQPASPEEAARNVVENLGRGADATKLFVATPQHRGKVARMEGPILRAAVDESHRRGHLVFAHPTDNAGLRAALESGVDAIMHTTLENGPTQWEPGLVARMVERNLAVVPTLKLWGYELGRAKLPEHIMRLALADAVEQVRVFAEAGGELLFGTDVGYMTDYNPAEEYELLARAGLTAREILAALTVVPARRWREETRRGRIAPGMDADLVVLNADPAEDVRNFAKVRCTFRAGELIYSAQP